MRVVNPIGFTLLNRGKQSVSADLRQPEGRTFVAALVAAADVVVEGFRPGVLAGAGLGFEAVSARNPHVIYASLSAYGQGGPNARRPGRDVNVLAAAGCYAQTLDMDDATLQRACSAPSPSQRCWARPGHSGWQHTWTPACATSWPR